MRLKFHKMHGFGNDFVILENSIELTSKQIKFLCDRHRGIGCDQLLYLKSYDNFIEMKTYNSDGNAAGFCGNGARCLIGLSYKLEKIKANQEFYIKNNDDQLKSFIDENGIVSIEIGGVKKFEEDNFDISKIFSSDQLINFISNKGSCINLGNPHIVFFVRNFDFDIEYLGKKIQQNKFFSDSVNVNFAKIIDNNIELKTFERGVGLTNACGSGACSTAFTAYKKKLVIGNNIRIQFSNNNDFLYVDVNSDEKITMRGGYNYVFCGEIDL